MTVSDKVQIASYEVSELIAQNMKSHILEELLILLACKKIVKTILRNEAAKEIKSLCPSMQSTNVF